MNNTIPYIYIYIFRAYNPKKLSLAVNENKSEKYEKQNFKKFQFFLATGFVTVALDKSFFMGRGESSTT